MNYQMTNDDFQQGLKDSIDQLEFLATAYDEGRFWAYRPMANIHRLLFRSTKRTVSLITRLGLEDILMYDSSHDYDPTNLIAHNGLGIIGISSDSTEPNILPRFHAPSFAGKWVNIDRWWSKIVYSDYANAKLARKDFVLNVCEQDIGSHADKELENPAYARLSRHWFGADAESDPSKKFPILGCEKAYLRQITHEVLLTFRRQGIV
jgi:hypothetical protein